MTGDFQFRGYRVVAVTIDGEQYLRQADIIQWLLNSREASSPDTRPVFDTMVGVIAAGKRSDNG